MASLDYILNPVVFGHETTPNLEAFDDVTLTKKIIATLLEQATLLEEKTKPTSADVSFFPENKTDTLFWCMYTLHHGHNDYLQIGNRYKNMEIQEKLDIVAWILKHQSNLKSILIHKMSSKKIQEHAAEFMANKTTTWGMFQLMCMFYGINAVVYYKNMYKLFETDKSKPFHSFYLKEKSGFGVDFEVGDPAILETMICIDVWRKTPLLGISNYSLSKLHEMLGQMSIEVQSTWKKRDMYDALLVAMTW
jgi:hypothetical protein